MSEPLASDVLRRIIADAARAPSVHNIQPARWRVRVDRVALYRAVDRALPVADPSGRDLAASLGAAWEGMVIALSEHGYTLGPPEHAAERVAGDPPPAGCVPVCSAPLVPVQPPEPDADLRAVRTRRSWRGLFRPATDDARRNLQLLTGTDRVAVTDRSIIDDVARLHDRASLRVMRQRPYFEETVRWLRLSPSDPRWARDGLSADALALGTVERILARAALRWPAFRALGAIGADRAFVSEAAQVHSAIALVAFTPPRAASEFESGRTFYRLWLAIERLGLSAVPMSAVCDDPETASELTARLALPPERSLRNLLRVGVATRPPATSARLPLDEILV